MSGSWGDPSAGQGGASAGRGAVGDSEAGTGPGHDSGRDLAHDLRDGFAALRRQEEQAAPSFASLTVEAAGHRRASHGRHRRFRPLATAATAAVALAALVIGSPWLRTHAVPSTPSHRLVPSISAWRPATDCLLRTPAEEVLTTAPTFGRGLDLGPDSLPSTLRDTPRRTGT